MQICTAIAPVLCSAGISLAVDPPQIPENYKEYRHASDTNLPPNFVRAIRSTEAAYRHQFGGGQTNALQMIYRVTQSGSGYEVSCLPFDIIDGHMAFVGGSSYFAVLDDRFKVLSIKPGA